MPQADLRTTPIAWTWQGHAVTPACDEAGEGPTILLLPAPSSISTRAELHPLMAQLAGIGRLVAPDWPAFGDHPKPPVPWTAAALSAFLDWFVQHHAPQPKATVAAGHAAAYALHLAAERPGCLGRLALLAPTWRGPLPTVLGGEGKWLRRLRRTVEAPVVGPALYRLNVNPLMAQRMASGHVYSDAAALPPAAQAAKREVMRARNGRFGSGAFVTGGLDRMAGRDTFLALARAAEVPILAVWGAETPPRSLAEMQALAALPGVQSAVLPRGKLAVHEEFAADVAEVLRPFLA